MPTLPLCKPGNRDWPNYLRTLRRQRIAQSSQESNRLLSAPTAFVSRKPFLFVWLFIFISSRIHERPGIKGYRKLTLYGHRKNTHHHEFMPLQLRPPSPFPLRLAKNVFRLSARGWEWTITVSPKISFC